MPIHRFSVWLTPSAESTAALDDAIRDLASVTNSPPFMPHITVLGGFHMEEAIALQRTAELAAPMEPVRATFTELRFEEVYIRSLYLVADQTPVLLETHRRTRQLFGVDSTAAYLPHLSLLYSDLPNSRKQPLIDRLRLRLPFVIEMDHLCLVHTEVRSVPNWTDITAIRLESEPLESAPTDARADADGR